MAESEKNPLEIEARRLLRESLENPETTEHPALEDLAAYHERSLEPAESETIRRHLVSCEDCMAVILDLVDLDEANESQGLEGAGAEVPSDLETARAWQRQQKVLEQDGVLGAKATAVPVPPTAPRLPPWVRAIAAVLATAVLGLGLWVASLRQTVADLHRLQTNSPLVNLEPVGSSRRSVVAPPILALPDETSRGWLVLNFAGPLAGSTFRAELLDASGASLLTLAPLERTEAGNFRMELSRRHLPTGEIQVLLFEVADDGEPVAQYRFRLSAL